SLRRLLVQRAFSSRRSDSLHSDNVPRTTANGALEPRLLRALSPRPVRPRSLRRSHHPNGARRSRLASRRLATGTSAVFVALAPDLSGPPQAGPARLRDVLLPSSDAAAAMEHRPCDR